VNRAAVARSQWFLAVKRAARGIPLGEDEVQDVQHRPQALGPLAGSRHYERCARRLNPLFGAPYPLRHRRLRHEERAGDLRRGQAADRALWHSIADPSERLETALRELYRYYERLEPLLENVQRDAAVMPLVAEMNAYRVRYLEEIRDLLLEAWTTRGGAGARLRRAIGHALEFHTWQSLVRRQGCATDEAVQLMVAFAGAAGSGNASAEAKARL
jgi:hypothetical protein